MKIGIIGSSPIGIELAVHFSQMGAFVRVFEEAQVGGSLQYYPQSLLMEKSWSNTTTELGRQTVKLQANLQEIPTIKQYLEQYYLPLCRSFSEQEGQLLKAKVERVHKRFLGKTEEVKGKSRLADLFRIVYSLDPVVITDENKQTYHELEEKLGRHVIDHLKDTMEYYEDFDLVMDCSGRPLNNSLGPGSSYAIGEKRLQNHPELVYGLKQFMDKRSSIFAAKELAIIGSGTEAAIVLTELKPWLEDKSTYLSLITSENEAFHSLENHKLKTEALAVLSWSEKVYQQEKEVFLAKIEDWKNLDDFVRVKIPRPEEPKYRLQVLEGVNVTSVDKLIDQPKIFLSLENPDFRKQTLEEEQIMTLGFDLALVMTGRRANLTLAESLRADEAGFFRPTGDLSEISAIEKNVLTFFSRA